MPLLAVQLWCEPVPLCVVKPSALKDKVTSQCLVVWHCKYCRAQEELSFQELSWDRDKLLTLLMCYKEGINPSHALAVSSLAMRTPAVARGLAGNSIHYTTHSRVQPVPHNSTPPVAAALQGPIWKDGSHIYQGLCWGLWLQRLHLRDW